MVDTILLVALIITSLLSTFFGFYAIKFGIILLRVQDQTEESLDILDQQYQIMTQVLEIPLANNSPQVKEIVECMKNARDSVLDVGNVLVGHSSKEEISEIEED